MLIRTFALQNSPLGSECTPIPAFSPRLASLQHAVVPIFSLTVG